MLQSSHKRSTPQYSHDAIIEAIEATNNRVKGEIINARYGPDKKPTSTFLSTLSPVIKVLSAKRKIELHRLNALCSCDHPANYKGCEIYKEILARRHKTTMPRAKQPAQSNQTPPSNPTVGNESTESHTTSRSRINVPGYSVYLTPHPDGGAHAGAAIIIKNSVKHCLLDPFAALSPSYLH
ncbi:hypothetical protein EVAR_96126_1 [Eumeta japonica]|uniref:Uncharacterized protein n=1 Tax=Eumeta variegata TaxID=151549 RepID=A0A4C1VE43_EUMVA|nr:hypothetical protein EVAR_96126_1 [Eumeta japonica]